VLPALLAVVAAGAAGGALVLSGDDAAAPLGDDVAVATPILSARRVPEVVAEPIARRRLGAELDAWLGGSPADTCLVVEDAGQPVYQRNPAAPLTGASTQKLFTATALLLALGPDATFTTSVVAAAAPSGGVVAGDLFVVGGGDAALATQAWPAGTPGNRPRAIHDVEPLVQAIVDAGVTRIDGSVVGDGSRYDDQRYQSSLASRLIDQDQVGPVGGLMINDGFAQFSPERSLASTVPAVDPAADFARVLTELLRTRGVTVAGEPRAGAAPEGAAEVTAIASPPIAQVVAEMLTYSDNETAEAAMKEIGRAVSDQGTWAAGAAAVTQLLTDAGVPMGGVQVVDGTGLTTDDRLTCDALVELLSRPETGPVVRDGLAVAGETGTLAETWAGTTAVGRLRAKTGTLRNATALAGEIDVSDGDTVTFAYVANVPDPGSVTAAGVGITGLADVLMGYPQGVDVARLEPAPVAGAATPPTTPPTDPAGGVAPGASTAPATTAAAGAASPGGG
jgi:D-alanyl-D-alanine carboxypeptidase/D-alanyl-D-alanine-endopeptidase (penicillin-binding protein 4)